MPKNVSTKKITDILADCYAIDPSLKAHDAELRAIVDKILLAKPDARPDADFVSRLKDVVMKSSPKQTPVERFLSLFTMRLPAPAGAAIAFVALIAVALTVSNNGSKRNDPNNTTGSTSGPLMVATLDRNAFGALSSATPAVTPTLSERSYGGSLGLNTSSATAVPAPQYDNQATASAGMAYPDNTEIAYPSTVDSKMMMPYEAVNYRYIFDGELPTFDQDVDVYRRVKGFGASKVTPAGLADVVGSMIDLSRFENASVQSFSISEDREFGLIANIDAVEGSINLSQDWRRWPHPENLCADEDCWARYRLSPSQVPSDDSMITIANTFLADRGIDPAGYASPEVRNDWRMGYLTASAMVKESYIAPDTISVSYPQLLDGKIVVDDSGMASGPTVSVNIRHMRVDGLWNLTGRSYERSSYAVETDSARIKKFVLQGGLWAGYTDPSAKSIDITLDTPEVVYLKTYRTSADGYSSDELYIPALRFPITTPPNDQQWFRSSVIIPITKESLDAADAQNGGGNGITPVPMPYAVQGSSGSSGSVGTLEMTAPAPTTTPSTVK